MYLRGRPLIGYAIRALEFARQTRGKSYRVARRTEYREMLRLLEKRGWKKLPSQTAREFASAIPAADILVPVAQLTELYQSARFGDHATPVEQMSSLLRSIRDLVRLHKG